MEKIISLRSLRRILSRAKLYRRKNQSDVLDVALFLMAEMETYGQLHGYKMMHLKCTQHGLVVSQSTVRFLLHIIDHEGIMLRKRNRLRRRTYRNSGPDFMWHVDSYDKLKPYGICINGAVDGFSRQVIWMEAYTTSSDPKVVGNYYMDAVNLRKGCPKIMRADRGTENVYIEGMHTFLRYDHPDELAHRSFRYGPSVHNQRIEWWWGFLRKQCSQFWMNLFQSFKDDDSFTGDFLDKNLIQFCFLQMIQVCNLIQLMLNNCVTPSVPLARSRARSPADSTDIIMSCNL